MNHAAAAGAIGFFNSLLGEGNLAGANLSGATLYNANLYKADFYGANLAGADLSKSNLNEGNLVSANLSGADLTRASLNTASFFNANLSNANLLEATLLKTDLRGTNLSGANLRSTQLLSVDLGNANLAGADLTHAKLVEVLFVDVDLSKAKGLDTCNHRGPSIIDFRSLERSGPLPLCFLRGCGLPERLIDYLPSLLNEAIQYYSCFISYSSKDQDFAHRLHADLQNRGIRCWFAPHDLPIGANTWDHIDEAIRVRDKLLVILSENSLASNWVEDEVNKAYAEERRRKQVVLFPIRIDNTVMDTAEPWAVKLRDQRNIGDFIRWKDPDAYQKSFERLVRDLRMAKSGHTI